MLNAGTYRGKATRGKLGLTSTGKEQVAVEFTFTDPPGQRLTWFGFFTDGTFDRTIESLRACGWKGNDLSEFSHPDGALPAGMENEVELVVEHEEYEGKVRARIAWVNSGGGLALKTALDEGQARAFAARMKGRIAALDQGAGRKPPTQQRRPPTPAGFNDVPQEELDRQGEEAASSSGSLDSIPF